MKHAIKKFWQSRQPRERGLLLLCAGLGMLALLWLGVQAGHRYQFSARQSARQAEAGLAEMEKQAAMLEPLLMRQQRQHGPNWQEDVLALAEKKGLTLELSGRDATRLLFSPAHTDMARLSSWLLQLEQEYRVHATRLLLSNAAGEPLLVQLVLQRDE